MPESFLVRVAKTQHVFSAAHFITYDGQCERLHGHNYHIAAEIFGRLNEDHLVVDFLAICDELRDLAAKLDRYVLLPTEHRTLTVREEQAEVIVTFENRRWIFPRGDCLLLPLANTTAELLAAYIGRQLKLAINFRCGIEEPHLRVELDECDGQSATWECRPE